MPKIALAISHKLGQNEATDRLKSRFRSIKEQFGQKINNLEEAWEGDTLNFRFTTFGLSIGGSVASEPSAVRVSAKLPMAATMFKRTIEQTIRDELTKMLS